MDKASPSCPIVNGGMGRGITINEILTIIGKNWTPELLPVFSGEYRIGDPEQYIADTTILNSWGFIPKIKIHYAIKDYVSWFQKEIIK